MALGACVLTLGDREQFWALGNLLHLVHPRPHPGPGRKTEAPVTVAMAPLIYTIQVLCLPLPGAMGRREAQSEGRRSLPLAERGRSKGSESGTLHVVGKGKPT